MYRRVTELRELGVNVMLAIGGWTDSTGDKYSKLVSSGTNRRAFVGSVLAFLRKYEFSGLSLEWNYPVCWQSDCKAGPNSDKANYAKLVQVLVSSLMLTVLSKEQLLKSLFYNTDREVSRSGKNQRLFYYFFFSQELRNAFDEETPQLILSVAISGYPEIIEQSYDLNRISKNVNFMTVMSYDYHGAWEGVTGHVAPLKGLTGDQLPKYNVVSAYATAKYTHQYNTYP